MTALFVAGLLVCNWAEANAHPALAYQVAGGNMEGKEGTLWNRWVRACRGCDFQRRNWLLQLNAR